MSLKEHYALRVLKGNYTTKKKGKRGYFINIPTICKREDGFDQNLCDLLFPFFPLKPTLGDFLEVLKACRRNAVVRVPVPQSGPSTIEMSIDAAGMTACTCKVHMKRWMFWVQFNSWYNLLKRSPTTTTTTTKGETESRKNQQEDLCVWIYILLLIQPKNLYHITLPLKIKCLSRISAEKNLKYANKNI